jgi:deferrochelatase/peroxidase EfeB
VHPEILGRNGSYVAFRKLHQRVEEFRKYLKSISSCSEEEELIAAKMMGRWRSGAPLARCPLHDDPALGADPKRNNDFLYKQDDPIGYKTPPGSHIRRMNPRDSGRGWRSPASSDDPARNRVFHRFWSARSAAGAGGSSTLGRFSADQADQHLGTL